MPTELVTDLGFTSEQEPIFLELNLEELSPARRIALPPLIAKDGNHSRDRDGEVLASPSRVLA